MIEIKSEEEYDKLLKENLNVCVDFWGPWCGPCNMLSPVLEEISDEVDFITFAKVNVDEPHNKSILEKEKISSIPTLIHYKEGSVSGVMNGFNPKQNIIKWLSK